MKKGKSEKQVERFLKAFQKDVKTKVNKLVAVQQSKARRQRKENIPSTHDVNQLVTYIDGERDKCLAELAETYSQKKWLYLSKLTMASILLFNRRRTGETQNMIASSDNTVPDRIKAVVKSRMQVRGKLERTVPVLLKHTNEKCIEILLSHRKDAVVPDKNPFLFALPSKYGKIKSIDACTVIRTFSMSCGVKNHTSLRGTKFRKHMASFCATMDLTDNDVTNVANFMGHDDQIHRNVYRHNTLEREVVQMTTLLEAAQGNQTSTPGTSSGEFDKNVIDLSGESSSEEDETIVRKKVKKSTARIVASKSNRKGKVEKRGRNRRTVT